MSQPTLSSGEDFMKIDHPTTDNAVLLLVDVQGKLARIMHDSEVMIRQQDILVEACRLLVVPAVWAEKVPNKLGPTVPELSKKHDGCSAMGKTSFGCWGNAAMRRAIIKSVRDRVLLAGIEAHVCVWQTAAALTQNDFQVHVIADAISSRSAFNRDIALQRMATAGIHLSNVEMALFEMMGDAAHPRFRDVSRLLR